MMDLIHHDFRHCSRITALMLLIQVRLLERLL